MKNPFSNIFKNHSKKIPEKITIELMNHFPHAVNIEWEIKDKTYEAIYYLDEVEHIAKISENGILIEYKKNLWLNELPEFLKEECNKTEEIMNAIAIFKGEKHFFEIIVRDDKFNRKLLLFNQSFLLLNTSKI